MQGHCEKISEVVPPMLDQVLWAVRHRCSAFLLPKTVVVGGSQTVPCIKGDACTDIRLFGPSTPRQCDSDHQHLLRGLLLSLNTKIFISKANTEELCMWNQHLLR